MLTRAASPLIIAIGALLAAALSGRAATAPRAGTPRVFADESTLALRIDAPFAQLFRQSHRNPSASVIGRVSYTTASGTTDVLEHVRISVRGHTSRRDDQCSFPKLKLDFDAVASAPREGDLFAGVDSIRIGTHCGDEPPGRLTPKFGRVANERTAHREAAVYRLLRALGVPALLARPARIQYVDGSRVIERDAFLAEDDRAAVRRIGGTHAVPPNEFHDALQTLPRDDAVRLALAEAMTGNFDWCLQWFRGDTYRCDAHHPLWNLVIAAGGTLDRPVPLLQDFDLSGMVTGRHLWYQSVFGVGLGPGWSEPATEVVAQLQRARSLFSRAELDRGRAYFLERRGAAFDAVAQADVDPEGRRQIEAYLSAFYDSIASASFYRPVIDKRRTLAFADAGRRRRACGSRSVLPVGTPVGSPLGRHRHLVRVRVLDVFWHWASPNECQAIHEPVWIDGRAIGTASPSMPRP